MASGGRDLDWSLIAGRECGQIGTEPKNGSKVGDSHMSVPLGPAQSQES